MKRIFHFLIGLSFIYQVAAENKSRIEIPLRFDRYYNYEDVVEALKSLHAAYPELSKLEVIGRSQEGRDIYALTINNSKTGAELSKPGVYVDGNIHGNEIQATEVCLYFANMLLTKYDQNEKIKNVVDKNTYYIVPVVNVDGRAHFFKDSQTCNTGRSILIPLDDDRDGLVDEDYCDDLDGDGNICQMRIKDPHGKFKTDPEDNRLMIPVKPGEKGEWSLLGAEGIDNDDDGQMNEDGPGYLDGNRNWGTNWEPSYVEDGAGRFPFSSKEIKDIANYIHQRTNIIVGFSFHNTGGMWLRQPSLKADRLSKKDTEVYNTIGKNAIKVTPGYVYKAGYDLYETHGDACDFMFTTEGCYSFVGELFKNEQETYRETIEKPKPTGTADESSMYVMGRTPDENREHINFNDHLAINELYKDWKPYKHPLYGDIEIGGWVKMSNRLPHPFMLQDLVHRNAMAVLFASEQTPEINMEIFDVKKVGENLHQIRVRLKNEKAISSMSEQAINTKLYPQDMLKLTGLKVIASGVITNHYTNEVNYQKYKPEIIFTSVPGNSYVEYQFLVEGSGEATIHYSSRKTKGTDATVKI